MQKLNLEATGEYEVRTENEGLKTINAALEFRPDLILLNIMMPDINGNEVSEKLYNNNELKDIKIVFLMAVLNIQETGIISDIETESIVIGKPVKLDKLIECIEERLS
jgi:CheY-like chemotaxis protein